MTSAYLVHKGACTGHRAFDKRCDLITTGNACTDGQFSSFIRPYTETECNGFTNPPGHLRKFDLKPFFDIPKHVLNRVLELTQTQGCILYRWRHVNGRLSPHKNQYITHGYTITESRRTTRGYRLIESHVTGVRHASKLVVETCERYVSYQ